MTGQNNSWIETGLKLPLIEDFYTIQGEGFHTGKPAYFIRIGGCDIGCRFCDTKVSWSYDIHQLTDIKQIVAKALDTPAKAVVVTGGEPSMYNLDPLCSELKRNGIQTFLETSGVYKLTGTWDWICLSPKKNKKVDEKFYWCANELKFIISDDNDFQIAEIEANKVSKNCFLYLQPEWSNRKITLPQIINYIKNNPKWNISLQVHKYIGIP